MSLLPLLFNDDYYPMRPSRILNQQFGMGLDFDDLVSPLNVHQLLRMPAAYYRPWQTAAANRDSGSTVVADKDKFQVNLDIQQFKPEEVTVKLVGENTVMIEGKHEEKQDEHGTIYRHFVRKYRFPEGHDMKNVVSKLSSDGVLSISAPRVANADGDHRTIPIQQTGVPSKPIEDKAELKENKMEN